MLRHLMLFLALVPILTQLGLAQDAVKKRFEEAGTESRPQPTEPAVSNVWNRLLYKASDAKTDAQPPVATAPRNNRPTLAPPHQSQTYAGSLEWQAKATVDPSAGNLPPSVDRAATPCVELDILIGCIAFDEKGELRVTKKGGEPEVNRAGTIGANLAAKLNEEREKLPAGASVGAAGANLLLQGLAGEKKLESLEQFRLRLSAGGPPARLQNGNRMPRIVGTSMRTNAITNTVEFENLGVLVSGSAQIVKTGKVALAIDIERSAFGPEEEGTPVSVNEGKTIRTPRIDTMTISSQVTVPDGEPTVLSSLVRLWGDKVTETFVVVTATVVESQ